MRLLLLPALLIATPALAEPGVPQQLPPEVASGQFVDQLQPVLRAMSKAFLNLPVGEIEAAVTGPSPSRRSCGAACRPRS